MMRDDLVREIGVYARGLLMEYSFREIIAPEERRLLWTSEGEELEIIIRRKLDKS